MTLKAPFLNTNFIRGEITCFFGRISFLLLTVDFKRCLAFSRAHVVGSLYGELAGDAATSAVDGATIESIGILE